MSEVAAKSRRANKRALRTRKAIMRAFDALMIDERIDKITVSALAREAGIDRKTFYLHFRSINDLINHKTEEMFERILSATESAAANTHYQKRVHLALKEMNIILMENVAAFTGIAENTPLDRIVERCEQALESTLNRAGVAIGQSPDAQARMQLRFYIAGALSLYATWLKSDRTQPIESVSQVIEVSIKDGLPESSFTKM